MSATPSSDIRCFSPFRTPDWRWRAASEHVCRATRPRKWQDAGIRRIRRFLLDLKRANTDARRKRLEEKWPDLFAANAIHMEDRVRRDELESRLLCESPDVIAAKMNIPAGAVLAYADAFYDVLGCLRAVDWLLEYAVRARSFATPPKENECWRYLALAGGPAILDLVVSDHLGRPEPQYPDRHELAERARFLVKDYANLVQTGQPADPEIIEEYCRLYQHEARRRGKKLDPRVAWHLKFLRMAAKLRKSRELEKALPKVRRRNARPDQDGDDICPATQSAGAGPDPVMQPTPAAEVSQPATRGAMSWMTDLDMLKDQMGDLKMPSPVAARV